MNENEPIGTAGEDVLGALLAASGARATPAEEQRQQVRDAVEAEWRSLVVARHRRRRVAGWAAAAAVAGVAVSAWLVRPLVLPPRNSSRAWPGWKAPWSIGMASTMTGGMYRKAPWSRPDRRCGPATPAAPQWNSTTA